MDTTQLDECIKRGMLTPQAIYLAKGGLVAILKNPSIGRNPRPVFLYQKDDAAWAHTFDQNLAGSTANGVMVPKDCLSGDKVFKPRKGEVTSFLQRLGVPADQVALIISAKI